MADKAYTVDRGLQMYNEGLEELTSIPKFIAYGTGTTEAASTDTTLENAGAEARTSGNVTQQTTNTTDDTHQVTGTIICTSVAKDITEVAIYDAITAGNLFLRASFTAIALSVDDSVTFTIKSVLNQSA